MVEKRRHKRLETEKYTFLKDEHGKEKQAVVVDISLGGMRIVLDTEIKMQSPISGQFKILPDVGPFQVKGEVIWVRPYKNLEEGKNFFEVGIKFNNITAVTADSAV